MHTVWNQLNDIQVHPKGFKPKLQNKDVSCDTNTQTSIGIDKGCISSPSKYQESHDKSHDETRESRKITGATKFVHSRRARQVVEDEESSSDNNSSSSSELEEDEEDGETKRKGMKYTM